MSKYYVFKLDYDKMPESKNNFNKTLKRLGQKDPKGIVKTSLHGRKPNPGKKLSDKQYISRGILNVRKELNRHLGKSGKYTNRMIYLSAQVEICRIEDNKVYLKSKLPYKAYKKIVSATYNLLKKCDNSYCKELQNIEQNDTYLQNKIYKSIKYKTVAPIQTNMIIRTTKGKTSELTQFAFDFRKHILEEK